MKLWHKILLGAAAVGVASAASIPGEFGFAPATWQQRQALSICQQTNSTFIPFLPSERESCYTRMRNVMGLRSEAWSPRNDTLNYAEAVATTSAR